MGEIERVPRRYSGDGEVTCVRAMASMMHGTHFAVEAMWWWACALKYLWRWPWKGGMEDLAKAKDCVERLMAMGPEVEAYQITAGLEDKREARDDR